MTDVIYANRVHESCSGTGAANLTLLGALSGKATFTSKVATGAVVPYVLLDGNGVDWEVGFGTLASATELQRTTVKDSSATSGRVNSETAGTPVKISLSSNQHEVFIAPFDKTVFSRDTTGALSDPSAVRAAIFVDNIAAMTALSGLEADETVIVMGGSVFADGDGGVYYWDEDDVSAENPPLTYQHDSIATGLFKRVQFGSIDADAMPLSYLETSTALASNSDTRVPSTKAVKAYADALIAANDAMVFKGVIDCSANPNYPAANRGDSYRVSVAGKIGGGSGVNVEAGDLLICLTDSTSAGTQAGVGSSWTIAQANIDGAVIGPASATNEQVAVFDGTTGKLLKDGGKTVATIISEAAASAVSTIRNSVAAAFDTLAEVATWIGLQRERLQANTTYYLNTRSSGFTDSGSNVWAAGNDSNDGLSRSAPWATFARAEQQRCHRVDSNNFDVVVIVSEDTAIDERFIINEGRGIGQTAPSNWIYRGDITHTPPTTHKVDIASDNAFTVARNAWVQVEGFHFKSGATAEHTAKFYDDCYVWLGNNIFEGPFGQAQIAGGRVVQVAKNYVLGNSKHGITGEVGGSGKWDFASIAFGFLKSDLTPATAADLTYSGDVDSAFLNLGEGSQAAIHGMASLWTGAFTGKVCHQTNYAQVVPVSEVDAIPGTIRRTVEVPHVMKSATRIALASATPWPEGDVSSATTIYLTPCDGGFINYAAGPSISDELTARTSLEISLALDSNSGHTNYHQSGKNYDVFTIVDPTTGGIRLATGPAWSSDTARGYSLVSNNGVWANAASITLRFGVNSGDTISVAAGCAVFHGSFRCSADGTTRSTYKSRLLSNAYNEAARAIAAYEATDSWTYSTFAFREMNNSSANRCEFLNCLPGRPAHAQASIPVDSNVASIVFCAIGLDSTTAKAADCLTDYHSAVTTVTTTKSSYAGFPGLGYHYLTPLEHGFGSNTQTWYGDAGAATKCNSGIHGWV
jgi:hypothetical protein